MEVPLVKHKAKLIGTAKVLNFPNLAELKQLSVDQNESNKSNKLVGVLFFYCNFGTMACLFIYILRNKTVQLDMPLQLEEKCL